MDKNKNNECVVTNPFKHKQTLGGNLFELYSDGFFVKEFISGFAYNKINSAIKFLNSEQYADQFFSSIDEVEQFSNLIGEHLIKDHLKKEIDMYRTNNRSQEYKILETDKVEIKDIKLKGKKKKK